MMKHLSVFRSQVSALLLLSGCISTRQAEINHLHTALAGEQMVINRDGRAYEAENEIVDRFNRQCLARLAELEH